MLLKLKKRIKSDLSVDNFENLIKKLNLAR